MFSKLFFLSNTKNVAHGQNDDFLITNAVTAIMAELPEDATVGEKLTALHDWETHRMHYDFVSFNHGSKTGNSHGTYAISATVATQIGGDGWNAGRSTTPSDNTQPYSMGMPDGWY